MIKKIILAIVFLFVFALAFYYRQYFLDRELISGLIKSLGLFAPICFCLLYIVAALAFFPASFITLISAPLFGLAWGLVYASIGTLLAAAFSFLLARYFAREWVAKQSANLLGRVQEGIKKDGWKYLAVMRLIPVLPFSILNYAFGLTPIGLTTYLITTLIASFPINFIYAYTGYLAGQVIHH